MREYTPQMELHDEKPDRPVEDLPGDQPAAGLDLARHLRTLLGKSNWSALLAIRADEVPEFLAPLLPMPPGHIGFALLAWDRQPPAADPAKWYILVIGFDRASFSAGQVANLFSMGPEYLQDFERTGRSLLVLSRRVAAEDHERARSDMVEQVGQALGPASEAIVGVTP